MSAQPDASSAPPRLTARRGFILWFTGLSGAGKSTLSDALRSCIVGPPELEVLDGDELRQFLTRDLTFSREDRDENVHRIAWVARRLARAGLPVVTAAISPYASTRAEVRRLAEEQSIPFLEVHAAAPLEVVAKRDVKGLYARARRGEIPHFTGVSDPYEPPQHPDLVVGLDGESPERSLARIVALLLKENLVITAAAEEERP